MGQSKEDMINSALHDLCTSLTAIAAKKLQVALQEAQFRATFVEVRGEDHTARLEFVGWHTWEDAPPRSMQMRKVFRLGEGCAGLAWHRNRAVIEDEFKDGHEWRDNYEGQNKKYKSMISVPVRSGYSDTGEQVIGVVTVDTQLAGYFGKKGDQQAEDRASAMIAPYGTYIAFVCALDGSVAKMKEIGAQAGGLAADLFPKLGGQRQLSLPDTGPSPAAPKRGR